MHIHYFYVFLLLIKFDAVTEFSCELEVVRSFCFIANKIF